MGGFFGFIGGIIGGIAAAVAAIPAVPAIVGGAVVGVALCVTGVICPGSPSNNGAGGGSGTTINSPKPGSGSQNSGGSQNGGSSPANKTCTSAPNPTCLSANITNTGTLVGGVCNATVPPDSSCPAPVISNTGFYAQPALIKSGEQTTLYWNVSNATACALSGGSLGTLLGLGLTGNHLTGSITQKTTYTLTCQQGSGSGPKTSSSVTVNLVPQYQNQ